MSNSSYVISGNTVRIFDSSVKVSSALPAGTYRVNFDQMSGHSLERIETMVADGGRVYGDHARRLDRIFAAYERFDRSLGVMLSGDKGMGKSLMLRMVAERAQHKLGLPAVLVERNSPGIAQFLDSLGEALVIFDEFEKVFPGGRDEENAQNQFLGLFDGISSVKRLYAITTNSVDRTSGFLVNRPGRFHYHIRFDYPIADEVREYLKDNLPENCHGQIESVVRFTQRAKINFDHLRAIAFELSDGSTFAEVIDDLNIKPVGDPQYRMEVLLKDGTKLVEIDTADLYSADRSSKMWYVRQGALWFRFQMDPANLVIEGEKMIVPVESIWGTYEPDDDDDDNNVVRIANVAKITMSLFHGPDYRYNVLV